MALYLYGNKQKCFLHLWNQLDEDRQDERRLLRVEAISRLMMMSKLKGNTK